MGAKRKAAQKYGQQMTTAIGRSTDMAEQMRQERAGYQKRAEESLGQAPTYNVPGQYGQYEQMMGASGTDLYNRMLGLADQSQQAVKEGYDAALDTSRQGAASLRDIVNKGVASSEGYAQTGMNQGLSDVQGFTDYYRTMASRSQLPGQALMEAQVGRNFAEGAKSIGQQAGGSVSGLGAMIDLYTNKANTLSDIGIQAAQYRANQENTLASAMERAQAVRQGIYGQMEQGALTRAAMGAEGEQAATSMLAGAQTGRADAMAAAANQAGGLTEAGITGSANLTGAGLMAGAAAQDTAYQFNQLMPWQTGMDYYTGMISSLNPYAAQADATNNYMNAVNNQYQLFGKKARFGNPTFPSPAVNYPGRVSAPNIGG